MEHRVMEKKDMKSFIAELMKLYSKVWAPVAKGSGYSFQVLKDPSETKFGYVRSILPPKKIIMPQQECLLKYKLNDVLEVSTITEYEDQAVIGVHPCDLRGIKLLDTIMCSNNPDDNYLKRREHTFILGIDCIPDKYCYCSSVMELKYADGFDLFMTDLGNQILLDIGSEKGQDILKKCVKTIPATKEHLKLQDESLASKGKMFTAKIAAPASLLPLSLEGQWNAPVWEDMGKKCLSCGQCVIACPTCYCFDVQDKLDLSLKNADRIRQWDGCQLAEFAAVGSGENFREHAKDRVRHRYHRKFKYHIDAFSEVFCTGCGRCWVYCPVEINLVEISNRILAKEEQCPR